MTSTFLQLEQSSASSVPIELYEFTLGSTTYYYTSTESDITVGSNTYVATQLSRSELVESSDLGKNNFTITAPDQFPVSLLFENGPPEGIVTLIIKRVQLGNLSTSQTEVIGMGRITTVDFPPLRSEITLETVFTSIRAAGIHRVYSINCGFTLYGDECKVDKLSYQSTATDVTQTGNLMTGSSLNDQDSGYYAGGIAVWQPQAGTYVTRGIKSHTNNGTSPGEIEITYEMPNYPSGGATLTLYPGCDHSMSTCINKYDNLDNYGGFPYMTQKNPWGSASIF